MDITVENINEVDIPAELKTALLSKLETDATAYLTGKGHIVKAKADYDNEVNTLVSTKEKEFAATESPKFYGSMDRLLAAVGMPKPDGMKTREWVDKLSTEGKLPFTEEQKAKIDKYLKGDGQNQSESEKSYAKQIKDEFDAFKKQVKEEKDKEAGQTFKQVISTSLKAAPVLVDTSIKDEALKTAAKSGAISDLTALFNSLYEGRKDENGVMGFVKRGTTDFLMNTATAEPMTPLEIVRKNHSMFLAPAGHEQKGGGTGGSGANNGTQNQSTSPLNDIYAQAAEKNLRLYSDAWHKFVNEEKGKRGI